MNTIMCTVHALPNDAIICTCSTNTCITVNTNKKDDIEKTKRVDFITSSVNNFNVDLNKYISQDDTVFLNKWIEQCNNHISDKKNIVILYGNGSNGKTTLIENMELYIGKKRVLRRRITDNTLIPSKISLVILDYQPGDDLKQLSCLYKYGVHFIIETNCELDIPMDCIKYVKVIEMGYNFENGTSKITYA